jgi:hypothetical protein
MSGRRNLCGLERPAACPKLVASNLDALLGRRHSQKMWIGTANFMSSDEKDWSYDQPHDGGPQLGISAATPTFVDALGGALPSM